MKTMKNFEEVLNHLKPEALTHYAQKLPAESVNLLKSAAAVKGISLELEIISRLFASLINPKEFGLELLCEEILNHAYTADDAFAECKRNKHANLHLYELEKLRVLMQYEGKIPRSFKEHFIVIDVKKARKLIEGELKAETEKNNHTDS